ncbi:hypothetical protein BT69DRAFT_1345148 [Atractiella rhizophila]|nr:hypothetical protein BT69DRAFT_1345148 [Atractiella rhizophila]
MTFKNQEFDFLDSLVIHLASLLDYPAQIGPVIKAGVDTLKGQVADLKDAVAALSKTVNPAAFAAETAESMASHLKKLHGHPNAKPLPSLLPHSVSHQKPPPPSTQSAANEALQLTLTWKAPTDRVAASALNDLLEEGAVPECTLIKEEPQKLVMIFNDLFMARSIPSAVYKKTPGKERAATNDPSHSPHVRVRAAQRLKSGDLRLHFYDPAEVQVAIDTQDQWINHLEIGWSIKRKSFPVIVHAVPTSFDIDSEEEVRRRIAPSTSTSATTSLR